MQTVWSHLLHLGNPQKYSCFSSFSISCHFGVFGVSVGPFVLKHFLHFSVCLNGPLSFPPSSFTGEKHMLTSPSRPLSILFNSGGLEADWKQTFKVWLPFIRASVVCYAAMPHCVPYCSEAVISESRRISAFTQRKKKSGLFEWPFGFAKDKRWRGGKKFREDSGLIDLFDSGSVVGS